MKSNTTDNYTVTIGTLTGLAATSVAYAMFLNSPTGRKWDTQHTWFMTVIGVSFTLGWLAITDPKAALKSLIYFAIAGTPVAIRAMYNELNQMEAITSMGGSRETCRNRNAGPTTH
jgi:hypothetical protein